jgi:acyl-homoserine-lactone acylase
VLEAWDRRTEPESRGAVLFAAWASQHCRGPVTNPCGFARGWSRADPLGREARLADPAAAAASLERAAAQLNASAGAIDVPWGQVMRIPPDLPGRGGHGDPFGIFQVLTYLPAAGNRPVHGDTWVAALEFAPDGPRGRVLMAYGNASQPGSPHDGDQLPLLARGEMRPLWLTRPEVEANLRERMVPER